VCASAGHRPLQWLLRGAVEDGGGVIEYAAHGSPTLREHARPDRGTGGAGGRHVGALTFDARYHSAVSRRARPTAVEPQWGARDSWSGCGRNMVPADICPNLH
jgi:hypothetical protein